MQTEVKKKQLVVFDIDGTLWDATGSIAQAWNTYFQRQQLSYRTSQQQIRQLAGRPYLDCLEAVTSRRDFDKEFLQHLNDEEKQCLQPRKEFLFQGVEPGLFELLREGYSVGLVSNCEGWYLERFLDAFSQPVPWLAVDCFGRSQIPKTQMLRRMSQRPDAEVVAYVGDTVGDWEAAEFSQVPFVGVSYGFGAQGLADKRLPLHSSFAEVVGLVLNQDRNVGLL